MKYRDHMYIIRKTTIISVPAAALCWYAVFHLHHINGILPGLFFAIYLTILSICLSSVCIVKQIHKTASPYRIFAVTDILLGIGIFWMAIADFMTDDDVLPGFLGAILLVFVIPFILLLLLSDVMLLKYNQRKNSDKR